MDGKLPDVPCPNGSSCYYRHVPEMKGARPDMFDNVCKFFRAGVCPFGDGCRWSHDFSSEGAKKPKGPGIRRESSSVHPISDSINTSESVKFVLPTPRPKPYPNSTIVSALNSIVSASNVEEGDEDRRGSARVGRVKVGYNDDDDDDRVSVSDSGLQ